VDGSDGGKADGPDGTATCPHTKAPLRTLVFSLSGGPVLGKSSVVQIPAAGGTPPYTWTLASGQLLPGLSLTPDGRNSGTPTTAGTYQSTLKVTDSRGAWATSIYTVTPGTSGTMTFALPTFQLPAFGQYEEVAFLVPAQGPMETLPWTFEITGLPAGLTVDAAAGLVSGVATTAFQGQITIALTDNAGQPAVGSPLSVSLLVAPPQCGGAGDGGATSYDGTYTCTITTVTPAGPTSGPGTFKCANGVCNDPSVPPTFTGQVDSSGNFTGTTIVCQGCVPLDVAGPIKTSGTFTIQGQSAIGSVSQTLVCNKS
jgi:hypothetical protein